MADNNAAQNARLDQHEKLASLNNIVPFMDALTTSIFGAHFGTLISDTPLLLTKDGDTIDIKAKPAFYKVKQQELYHFILERVTHTATLSELKMDSIRTSETCGKTAYDHLSNLKARTESDVVESVRRKLRKLREKGVRASSEDAFDEFASEFEARWPGSALTASAAT